MEDLKYAYIGLLLIWVALAILMVMVIGTRKPVSPAAIPQERIKGKMPVMHGDHDA